MKDESTKSEKRKRAQRKGTFCPDRNLLWVSPMTTGDRSQEPVARSQESVQGNFLS